MMGQSGGSGGTAAKRYICGYCGTGFCWRSAELRRHELMHDLKEKGERPWICELCGKGYTLPRYLKQHKEVVHWKIRKNGRLIENVGQRVGENVNE